MRNVRCREPGNLPDLVMRKISAGTELALNALFPSCVSHSPKVCASPSEEQKAQWRGKEDKTSQKETSFTHTLNHKHLP